jgi:O-antigen/teichoic acid export membrane protein
VNLTINLVVNLALIPSYGAEGAAIAIMLSEGAGFLLSLIATGRRMHNLRLYDLLGRPAGVALVSAIPALWLGEIHALISAGLISGVYIALSLFAGVIPENDRRMAFNTLKERV